MKLKSISTHGFKSFADRINVSYHDGITGVIGPNGSGKSNIIDAVRWVMGEQTAKNLRAEDPTDIIFAGSQNRKPLSMAEVTLTFANDGHGCPPEFLHLPEISIGRRIYRDGEREYFLNKQACRLKDIVDFLLSIGLGAKSYSIIQQEKRDRIIQASPDDMREILEETAGISAFKQHRKEAEKRLASTDDKLRSLSEIENELVNQSETLKVQVEKAAQKLKLVTDLREKEIALIADHIHFYKEISTKLETEINARTLDEEQSQVKGAEWEARANNLKADEIELASEIKNIENEFSDKRQQLTRLTERERLQKQRNDERVLQKEQLLKELSEERQGLQREEERLVGCLRELEATETDLRKIDGELEHFSMSLEELDESLNVERVRGEEIRSEMHAIESALSTLRARNEGLLQTIERINHNIQKHEDAIKTESNQKSQLVADRREIEFQVASVSKGLESVASEKSQIDTEMRLLDDQIREATAARDTVKEQYVEINGLYNSLQKLVSANEGLSDGARMLREKLSSSIKGFLFENVTVHRDDEHLLERGLPQLLQAALVADTETLVDLLDKVEELGMSRVGFIVSDLLGPLNADEQKAHQSILAIPGMRCVGHRAQNMTDPHLKFLLDRIFIARDEWLALKAQRLGGASGSFIFVSERGTIFANTHEISAGEHKESEGHGILQRKRELLDLEKRRDVAQNELAGYEGRLMTIAARRRELEGRSSEIEGQLSNEKSEVQKLTGALDGFDLKIKYTDDAIKRHESELASLTTERETHKEQFASHQGQSDRLEDEKRRLARDLEDFDSEFSDRKERRETIATQSQNKKAERAVIQERQANYRRTYEESRLYVQRTQQKVDRNSLIVSEIESQISNADSDEAALMREIEQLRKDSAVFEEKLNEALNREAHVNEELRVIENTIKSQKDADAKRQKLMTDKRVELERIKTVLATAEKDAWERFNLKMDELPPRTTDEPEKRNKLEKDIKRLQEEIAELGAVNELALQEFESVEERRAFLIAQKTDILNSIDELKLAIAEIEETTKSRFQETYEVVNKEFQKLFPVLFPGGSAELHMLKPEDLLNTGVEILVKLPGKKQQNMSLFSGGEKALTAISLIFAFLKTRPAPFCFLDEVDAPLDEANVGRFNAVLEALSGEFQFVVITHNRRTMEVLDTIYGISMTEPGVSRLVSVDLSEVPPHLRKKEHAAKVAPAAAIEGDRAGASVQ